MRFACECGLSFHYTDAMLYIEHSMGEEAGRAYWIKLRTLLDKLRREKHPSVELVGFEYPTEN